MPAQFFIDNVKLRAVAGLTESHRLGFGKAGLGDARVFIDGKLKFDRTGLRPQNGVIPVDIALGPKDRFLTLFGTGGEGSNLWNWMLFGDPVLEMVSTGDSEP
jgi:hypothetical protein